MIVGYKKYLPKIVRGSVDSAGAAQYGEFFSSSGTTSGGCTVTFTEAFDNTPTVIVTPNYGVSTHAKCKVHTVSTTGFVVTGWQTNTTFPSPGAALDTGFEFVALGY